MDGIQAELLLPYVFVLILFSAFFSGSETGMMAINRYRLRHQANKGLKKAQRVAKLLTRPDRLLGVILIGNTFTNNIAASLATIIGAKLYGDVGIIAAPILLTLVILIFAEITPKTIAALKPEWVAYHAALPLKALLTVLYPLVWLANSFANTMLKYIGVRVTKQSGQAEQLTVEELRTLVFENSGYIPATHREMLLAILELETIAVEGVMTPKNEIVGIDLNDEWETIRDQIMSTRHYHLPVYKSDIEDVIGILSIRDAWRMLLKTPDEPKEFLETILQACYFIPESTPLHVQLLQFQKKQQRFALAVNEYGDIQGIVTIEDILEEIVGELSHIDSAPSCHIHPQSDGSFIVDASATLRELKKELPWEIPAGNANTLSGTIIDYLESIPSPGTCLKLENIAIEVILVKNNTVKKAKVSCIKNEEPLPGNMKE